MRLPRLPRPAAFRPVLALALLLGVAAAGTTRADAADRTYDGLVIPFKDVVVSSPVQAPIVSISVKEGDRVAAGQELASLYSRIEELDMLRMKADLEKKQFDFKGSRNLYADKIISEDEALKNKIELDLATLSYSTAAEIYHQRTIRAPIDGIVVEKIHEVGETATPAQPLFRVLDISRIYVQFFVRAEDLAGIHLGDSLKVRFPVLDAARTFTGAVDFIDPRVDAASGLLKVKVLVSNPDGFIKAGVRAEVLAQD